MIKTNIVRALNDWCEHDWVVQPDGSLMCSRCGTTSHPAYSLEIARDSDEDPESSARAEEREATIVRLREQAAADAAALNRLREQLESAIAERDAFRAGLQACHRRMLRSGTRHRHANTGETSASTVL